MLNCRDTLTLGPCIESSGEKVPIEKLLLTFLVGRTTSMPPLEALGSSEILYREDFIESMRI